MRLDAWLPVGHKFPDGATSKIVLFEGMGWQIFETMGGGRVLVAHDELTQKWIDSGIIEHGFLTPFNFGDKQLWSISCSSNKLLCLVSKDQCTIPWAKSEALAFAQAFKATRDIETEEPLQDAIYVEHISRLLPTYNSNFRIEDDLVLGHWLTGGVSISVKSFRRLHETLNWLGAEHLKDVIEAGGFQVTEIVSSNRFSTPIPRPEITHQNSKQYDAGQQFELPGRPNLENFINEYIVDIIQNRERYKAFGIEFPSAMVLHGPPGCGKTFAVECLIDYLGWPSFRIEASSVASPYVHETSRKVADVFERALQNAPSILVIDEMEAFVANREMGDGHHRIEEVAEFLRRIPEAIKNDVLIIGMTNRIDMIDSAILRRGRFDHIIKVDFASEAEVSSLLEKLLSSLPKDEDIDLLPISKQLAGRPLSDVAFVAREGARLTARSGNNRLKQENLLSALYSSPAREREGGIDTKQHVDCMYGEEY